MRVCVFGATGTIGRATVAALVGRGHQVTAVKRARRLPGAPQSAAHPDSFAGYDVKEVTAIDAISGAREVFGGEPFDAVISCMASRTGVPSDAWAVDCAANSTVLEAAQAAGVSHFILLSAICVQKPLLPFQQAKLAFERTLVGSGMRFSIVRPTAFFKSLSGQIDRVKRGRPFLLFGDGTLTACKPISDRDLAAFVTDCLTDESRWDRILPIGGPGPAITPRDQGEALFAMLGRAPKFRSVPVALIAGIARGLGAAARIVPALAEKAALARIGHYYATESMLVLDPQSGRYDAGATPSTGTDTLFDYYRSVLDGTAPVERGAHAVFSITPAEPADGG